MKNKINHKQQTDISITYHPVIIHADNIEDLKEQVKQEVGSNEYKVSYAACVLKVIPERL